MAKQKRYFHQLYEGTNWNDYTTLNHIRNVYEDSPVDMMNRLEKVLDMNAGANFISMVAQHGIHEIDAQKDKYQWFLENDHIKNYPLVGAYEDRAMTRTVGTTGGFRAGANGSKFYMVFENKPFGVNEHIVGLKPDLYRLWITDDPINVGGDKWLYEVQLTSSNADFYVAVADLAPIKTLWSADGAVTIDELSYTGPGPSFSSHSKLENNLSQFRMKYKIPGNLVNYKILSFHVKDSKGKPRELWMSNVEYEFMLKARYIAASIVVNGQSNVREDGTIANVDKSGITATTGAGFKQQWSTSNYHTWSLAPSLEQIREITLDAVVGKTDKNKRSMIIKAGEHGLTLLSDMVMRAYGATAWKPYSGAWATDGTGRAFSWNNNDIMVKTGQVMGIALINGIELTFVLDPSKDDRTRNKMIHPLYGGPVSSYEYDIMGFGGKDEKSNMQIVRRKGETPIWGVEEGLRGWFHPGSGFKAPKQLSHAVDASTIHYFDPGIGAIVWDPTKIIRYYPSILT